MLLEEDKNKVQNELTGGTFVKTLNGCMLRILENSRPSDMFLILFNLLIQVQTTDMKFTKATGLITKCILKLAKVIPSIMDHLNISDLIEKFNLYFTQVIKFDT